MRKRKAIGLGLNEQEATPKTPYRRKAWLRISERQNGPHTPPAAFPDPEIWIPETHVRLKEAFELVGMRFVPEWTGNERNARTVDAEPDPPWNWLPTGIIPETRYQIISDDGEIELVGKEHALKWWFELLPVLRAEWTEEQEAKIRQSACYKKLRNLMAAGKLQAQVLTDKGHLVDVPQRIWRSRKGHQNLKAGVAIFEQPDGAEPKHVKGIIVVRHAQLALLRPSRDSVRVTLPESLGADAERFPYLSLMLEAAKSELFELEGRVGTKKIEGWLSDNWPQRLGGKSTTKLKNMATLLRRPEDEKGGVPKGKGPDV